MILVPGLVLETPVALIRPNNRLHVLAHHALGRGLPKPHVVLPERDLGADQLARVGHHLRGHLQKGAADIEWIEGTLAAMIL